MTTAVTEYRVYGLPIESKSYGMNDNGTLTIKGSPVVPSGIQLLERIQR